MNRDLVLILEAAAFAADKHRTQRRRGADASPYINHPLALADILAREGGVEDSKVIAAALLHDTVEDTDTSIAELEARFGVRVASIVAEVTDDKSLPKSERKYLQVVKAAMKSPDAKLVKLADKIANLRDLEASPPSDWSADRRAAYFDWSREVFEGLRGTNVALEAAFDEVHSRYVRSHAYVSGKPEIQVEQDDDDSSAFAYVVVESAKCLYKPDKEAAIRVRPPYGSKVQVLREQGEWALISFCSKEAWCLRSALATTLVPKKAAEEVGVEPKFFEGPLPTRSEGCVEYGPRGGRFVRTAGGFKKYF